MSDHAAIVARIAEALAPAMGQRWPQYMSAKAWREEAQPFAEAVADALGLPAILGIVEERRNAHTPACSCFDDRENPSCPVHGDPRDGYVGCRCRRTWTCDERKALDAIHNHLTGSREET